MVLLFGLNSSGLAQVSYNTPHLHIRLVNEDPHHTWTRLPETTKLCQVGMVEE